MSESSSSHKDNVMKSPPCGGTKRPRRFSVTTRTSVEESAFAAESLANAETRAVTFLRVAGIVVLLASAAAVSTGVYYVMRQGEQEDFTSNFQDSALQLIKAFHEGLERNIGAVSSMSTTITSHALNSNMSFPFVTIPDFELRGADLRVQSGSSIVVYAPLVIDDTRTPWEDYALDQRGHIDEAFQRDTRYRLEQDAELKAIKNQNSRMLEMKEGEEAATVLPDGTGYHPSIFTAGFGDEPAGSGPYLPVWQRSPIDTRRQALLNRNLAQEKELIPDLESFLYTEKKAIFNEAMEPSPETQERVEETLNLSQFRNEIGKYANDLYTYMVYPVFDSFEDDRKVAGVLVTDIFWKFLFRHLLPETSVGIICVIENSFGQTFSYRVDGPDVTFLGMEDAHDSKYNDEVVSEDVFSYMQKNTGAHSRAYKTVGLSDMTQYTIRVYPSEETEHQYVSSRPITYALFLVAVFTFACALLITYSCVVEKRQTIMMNKVMENARRAAETERELNEFLHHEIRNPLSAAISASTFVSSAVNEPESIADPETRRHVREDIEIVNSSLSFINDFLRSMLDIYKATGNKIIIEMEPANVKTDILEPVAKTLCKRTSSFDVIVDCPDNLFVRTDSVRLKQVILNLVSNSSKYVQKGFIRMRADIIDEQVCIFVEDTGPGVAREMEGQLFAKYQQSLDLLSQGRGVGLNLSKKLMEVMKGDLHLDKTYHSGLEGCPGARFVVQLNTPSLDMASPLISHTVESDGIDGTQSTANANVSEDFCKRSESCTFGTDTPVTIAEEAPEEPLAELPEGLSCLFVDDDALLRKLFMRAIKRVAPSWYVQDVASGEEALKLCGESRHAFNVIFVDQYMSSTEKRLLGTETVDAMRKKGIDSKICGLSANDVKGLFLQSGADSFMLKPMPCKPDALKTTLLGILDT